MENKEDKNLFRLRHIIVCIKKLEYIAPLLHTYDDFVTKWTAQDIVIRNLEIIGEAVAHISDDLKQNYPEIPWKDIKRIRNIVVHEYFGINLKVIWNTLNNDIPILKNQIQTIIDDIEKINH